MRYDFSDFADFFKTPPFCFSFSVYQMAPRSWRPESSLAATVPEDNAANHVSDVGERQFEEFVAAPPGGAAEKEVETISWTLSSNQIITTSNLERYSRQKRSPGCHGNQSCTKSYLRNFNHIKI